MTYCDIKNSIDTAKREGKAEGMIQQSIEIARKMLANGMDAAKVMEITGLSGCVTSLNFRKGKLREVRK